MSTKFDSDEKWQWWEDLLTDHYNDGRRDAERGVFRLPYLVDEDGCCQDPNEEDENLAYREGFDERRRELGKDFRWR